MWILEPSPMIHASNKTQNLRAQGHLTHALRSWFFERGYLEVYTPIMVTSPALEEHLEAIYVSDYDSWLHTSPEFGMKKLLGEGLCRIYQITPCFRKEEIGIHHRTEFRMLEWYRAGASWWDLAHETIDLIQTMAQSAHQPSFNFDWISTQELLPSNLTPDEWFFRWVDEIEPNLPKACIVYDYPEWQAALARRRHNVAERFEVYINGVELANAFDEESSSAEIHRRWIKSNQVRMAMGKRPYPIDEQFLKANQRMPRCSGIAMGIDRLFMLLTNQDSIHDLFV